MDRKSLIVLAAAFAILLAWMPLTNKLFPPKLLPIQPTNAVVGVSSNGITPLRPDPNVNVTPVNTGFRPENVGVQVKEETLTLENEDARYVFTSTGGGLKHVSLKKYPESVAKKDDKKDKLANLNAKAPVPALSLMGPDSLIGDGVYQLSKVGSTTVRAEKLLQSGLRIIKEYQLSTNYLIKFNLKFENRTREPIQVPAREIIIGTATPIGVHDEAMYLGLDWYNGSAAEHITESWFANRTLGCFPGQARTEYSGGASNVVWAAVHNQFFTMIAVPQQPADRVMGRQIQLAAPTKEDIGTQSSPLLQPLGYQTSLAYNEVTVPANQIFVTPMDVFAGPKEYNLLARLDREVDLVMGFDGFIGFFAKSLLLSLNGLHALGFGYGLAIIIITIAIKLIFWPLSASSTRSMKRMQKLQPQMKAIQDKYKDEPTKMQGKLSEFMKENKINPVAGCLPMIIQIPVFFGFYRMLQAAIELRGASFLWAHDLSSPDTIATFAGFPINPFPLLMGATMLWQAQLTPASPGMDAGQQRIMKYMPLMMMVFLYNFSAGLTIYWTVQNILSIAQMKLTRDKPLTTPAHPAARPSKKS